MKIFHTGSPMVVKECWLIFSSYLSNHCEISAKYYCIWKEFVFVVFS